MFEKIQKEHKIWAAKNFGEQVIEDYELGMIEEVGELAHAVLKQKQNIRNNENHAENILDAVGDITIYLIGYCNIKKINIDRLIFNRSILEQSILGISRRVNEIIFYGGHDADIETLIDLLIAFCGSKSQYLTVVEKVWSEVSKRDWRKNPDNVVETE